MKSRRKKGQNIILGEVLLFAIGLVIANYVIVSFQKTESRTGEVTLKDNFQQIANAVSTAVVKASESANSSVRLFLPASITNRVYAISLKGGDVVVFDLNNPAINVTQKLFNITQENCISNNAFCAAGDAISSSRAVEIFSDGKNVVLRRLRIT